MNVVRERLVALYVVSIECMPALTIINKSFTAPGPDIFVGGYNFCDTRERLRDRRNFLGQVDQQITAPRRCGAATNRDRCRRLGHRSIEYFVGHETSIAKCPQQLIDLFHRLPIRGVNVDGIVESIGFLGEPAGKSLAGLWP